MLDAFDEFLLREVCREASDRLRAGERKVVETLLQQQPEIAKNPDQAIELIFAEFVAREQLGEAPQAVEYCERFPQWRDRIERLLKIHQVFDDETAVADGDTRSPDETDAKEANGATQNEASQAKSPAEMVVGDYEILDELGRGGMGVVYKARHRTLGRLVALKEILSTRSSLEQEKRLLREASTAARLQHTNIVQIFEIGEGPGGPFLSMELLNGGSLDQKLAKESPSALESAKLVKTLAHAMDYAHQNGVVHRDLKPANVLLSADGEPKISDFGLAKIVAGNESKPPDADWLTRTGAILGTPCYMAPEQVQGEGAEVGASVDIYALGAVLYELLTGRPPFRSESLIDTFQLIRDTEPVRPSRLNHGLPRDLETICLKCLSKDPRERYPDAKALADELTRFIADEPIVARPIHSFTRAYRWGRQRPLVAGLIAALLLSLAGGFVAVTSQWMRAERQTIIANWSAEQAELRLREVERERNQANVERNSAVDEQARAEANLETAQQVVEQLTQLWAKLTMNPEDKMLGRAISEQSLRFHESLWTLDSSNPKVRFQVAQAHQRAARIFYEIGQLDEAERTISKGIEILESLSIEFPSRRDYRRYLVESHFVLASAMQAAGNLPGAQEAFRYTVTLGERCVEDFPDEYQFKSQLATTLTHLWTVLDDPDKNDASFLKRAVALTDEVLANNPTSPSALEDAANGKEHLGLFEGHIGNLDAAEDLLREALQLRGGIRTDGSNGAMMTTVSPTISISPVVQTGGQSRDTGHLLHYKARNHNRLAVILEQRGRFAEADEQFRSAIHMADRASRILPRNLDYRRQLVENCLARAKLLDKQQQLNHAISAYHVTAKHVQHLAWDWPHNYTYHERACRLFLSLAEMQDKAGQTEQAGHSRSEAVAILVTLATQSPDDPDRQRKLDGILEQIAWDLHKTATESTINMLVAEINARQEQLPDPEVFSDSKRLCALADGMDRSGELFFRLDRQEVSLALFRQSLEFRTRLATEFPHEPNAKPNHMRTRYCVGRALSRLGRSGEAIAEFQKVLQLDPQNARANNLLAWEMSTCKDPQYRDPSRAVQLAETATELAPTTTEFWNTLGAAYYRLGRYADAVQALDEAIQANSGKPSELDLVFLAMCEYRIGNLRRASKYFRDATAWWEWHAERYPPFPSTNAELERLLEEAKELLGPAVLNLDGGRDSGTIHLDDVQLIASARSGERTVMRQRMRELFGPSWSDGTQLWWKPGRAGKRLVLAIEVEQAGMYVINGYFTKARDYGQFQLHVNGEKVGELFDGFNPRKVIRSGCMTLGSAPLKAGGNEFVFELVGTNPASSGNMVGIDHLDLVRQNARSQHTDSTR